MPVVFYTTFSPSPRQCPIINGTLPGLFVSVALFRQVSSSRRVPRPGCYPTPCSMECGLSSAPTTQDRDRPTDLRQHYDTRNKAQRQRSRMIFKQFSNHPGDFTGTLHRSVAFIRYIAWTAVHRRHFKAVMTEGYWRRDVSMNCRQEHRLRITVLMLDKSCQHIGVFAKSYYNNRREY